jgi:hypothetical protein
MEIRKWQKLLEITEKLYVLLAKVETLENIYDFSSNLWFSKLESIKDSTAVY